jgi:hypothetical protein
MSGSTDESQRSQIPSDHGELDEALEWFDDLDKTQGRQDLDPVSPPITAPPELPVVALPGWLRRDMARVRTLTQAASPNQTPDTDEDDNLSWMDEYATDLGAPTSEAVTHQWMAGDGAQHDEAMSEMPTRVVGSAAAAAAAAEKALEQDDDDVIEDIELEDEEPALAHREPPSAAGLLDTFPDDPDEAVGYLEEMARQDESKSVASKLAAAAAIEQRQSENAVDDANDVDDALVWAEKLADESSSGGSAPLAKKSDDLLLDESDTDDNPLAWLEQLSQEKSHVGDSLAGEKSAEIDPEPDIVNEDPTPAAPTLTPTPVSEQQLAREALANGDIEQATALYKVSLRNDADVDQVIGELTDAIEQHPQEAALYRALGDAYARKGDSARAAAAFRDAVRIK